MTEEFSLYLCKKVKRRRRVVHTDLSNNRGRKIYTYNYSVSVRGEERRGEERRGEERRGEERRGEEKRGEERRREGRRQEERERRGGSGIE